MAHNAWIDIDPGYLRVRKRGSGQKPMMREMATLLVTYVTRDLPT
jgi:hypothetical protein